MHFALVKVRGEDLDVTTSTINLLLMLDSKLYNQGFPLIAKRLKTGREGIKAGILAGLDTW